MTKKTGLPCPKCSSSDAYSIQENGWGKCFSCNTNFPPSKEEAERKEPPKPKRGVTPIVEVFKALAYHFSASRQRAKKMYDCNKRLGLSLQ